MLLLLEEIYYFTLNCEEIMLHLFFNSLTNICDKFFFYYKLLRFLKYFFRKTFKFINIFKFIINSLSFFKLKNKCFSLNKKIHFLRNISCLTKNLIFRHKLQFKIFCKIKNLLIREIFTTKKTVLFEKLKN